MGWLSSTPSSPVPLAESVREALTPLVNALTQPDEAARQAAVRHVLAVCLPQVIRLLCERLVERLLQGGEATCRLALASLVEIGGPAARVVADRLTGTRASGVQVRLADTLAAIGERLPQADPDWYIDVGIARRLAASDEARKAIDRAAGVMRAAGERPAPTSGPGARPWPERHAEPWLCRGVRRPGS